MLSVDGFRDWAEELQSFLLIPRIKALAGDGGWFAGGCWTLAEALKKWVGRGARLFALHDENLKKYGSTLLHVVVNVDDLYVDADGALDEDELLAEWDRPGRKLRLKVFRPEADVRSMQCPAGSVKTLVSEIEGEFGRFEDLQDPW